MQSQHEPTADQLQAMAYFDGELNAEERASFEQRMQLEPDLAREVSEYRALQILARQMAPPEPMDHEWARLELDPTQRSLNSLGWVAFVGGALGLAGFGIWGIATEDGPLLPRALTIALIGGMLVLLLGTVRARLRTMPYDSYREVQR